MANELYEQIIEDLGAIVNSSKLGKDNVEIPIPYYTADNGKSYRLTSREVSTNEGFKNAIDDEIDFIILYGPRAQNYISKLKRKKFINNHKTIITIGAVVVGALTGGTAVAIGAGAAAIFAGIDAKKLAQYEYQVPASDIVTFKLTDTNLKYKIARIIEKEETNKK